MLTCRDVYLKLLEAPLLATRKEPDRTMGRGEAAERKKENEERGRRNRRGGHIWGHNLSPQCGKPVEFLDCPSTGASEFLLSDLTQLEFCFFYL